MICKKIMLGFLLGLISMAQPAFAVPSTADIIMVHDMDMINQQRFRMEELNDYNDVKTEKERYQKRNNPTTEPLINRIFSPNPKKFVEEDGKIKIEQMK